MKKNKIFASALALAMGLGAIAPATSAFAAEDSNTNVYSLNNRREGRNLIKNIKRLENGDQDVPLSNAEEAFAESFDNLSETEKQEVINDIQASISKEGYIIKKDANGDYAILGTDKEFELKSDAQDYVKRLKISKGRPVKYIQLANGKYAFIILPKRISIDYDFGPLHKDLDKNKDQKKEEESDIQYFDSFEEAETAAKEALAENNAFKYYNIYDDKDTGKFYYILSLDQLNDSDKKIDDNIPEDNDDNKKTEDEENNEIGYNTKDAAETAAKEALKNDNVNNTYKLTQNDKGKWFYTLSSEKDDDDTKKGNNEIGYDTKQEAIENARGALIESDPEVYESYKVYQDENTGKWFYTLTKKTDTEKTDDKNKDEKIGNNDIDNKDDSKKVNPVNTTTGTTTVKPVTTTAEVNKENLNKAIVDAEILIKDEKGTQEQRNRLQKAIDHAREVRDKANVTQSELDQEEKAVRDIMNEILGITSNSSESNNNPAVSSNSNVKTGVVGIAGVAGILAAATAGYTVNKKNN